MIQYVFLLRFIGYGLLILTLFDVIYIIVPPLFMNPAWELQTLGTLVEHTPVPLIGIGLIFFGEWHYRTKLEKQFLKYFSWSFLVLGILFLILLPLEISNVWRLNNQNNAQIITQVFQQKAQIEQLKKQLNQASDRELVDMAKTFNQPDLLFKNPQKLKDQLLSKINQAETKVDTQSQVARKNMFTSLLKNSIKLLLANLVLGILFIYIWRFTAWARNASYIE